MQTRSTPAESPVPRWRQSLGKRLSSPACQNSIAGLIIFNALILGLETDAGVVSAWGGWLSALDRLCLALFVLELTLKMIAFRGAFWRNGWNLFDFAIIAIALVPGSGPWSVIRTLRILRVLRLVTVLPSLRRIVAAILHSIPGILGVITVMAIFFYTAAVLATQMFGASYPDWFGSIGRSLFSLFQIMTLESWSMGIVRPVMESHPWAWAFFVPFIIIATFTILNLFLGIIVSAMQELSMLPDKTDEQPDLIPILERIDHDLQLLRARIEETHHTPDAKARAMRGKSSQWAGSTESQ